MHRGVATVGLGLGLGACQPELPDLRYETDHLRIGTDFDEDVCEGSFIALEAHIDFLELQLGIELKTKIELYWLEDGSSAFCDGTENCTTDDPRRVFTTWDAARHELVHAVAFELGAPDNFIAEGLADGFDGRKTEFGDQSPYLAVGYDSDEVDYPSAAHFVRWLHATEGSAPLRELLKRSSNSEGPGDTRSAFEQSYSESLEDAELRYYAEAPERYPTTTFCEHESLGWNSGLDVELELACDADHTWGAGTMWRSWQFSVDVEGWYVVSIEDPAQVLIFECNTNGVPFGDELPPTPKPPVGEDPGGTHLPRAAIPFGYGTYFDDPQPVYLRAQDHRVDVGLSAESEAHVRLSIRRRVGPASP